MTRLNAKGASLVEVMVAVAILGAVSGSVVLSRILMARQTLSLTDENFASGKALQMFNELQGLALNSPQGAAALEPYDDGPRLNVFLTTDKNVERAGGDPADALSGNQKANGQWRFGRHVRVYSIEGDLRHRQVVVQVWKASPAEGPLLPDVLLATMSGLVGPDFH